MSHVDDGFRSLTLKRFPQTDDVNPLLAWEAADEYLLQQLDETEIRGPVLILNDTFGALSCALAEHSPYSIGDSYLSELGTRENLRHNGIAESSVTFLDSTADYPQAPGVVLIKVPKTLALLEQQLRALRKVVTAQTRIIAGAKARDIHTSTLELFEKVLGPTTTTLAWKKARLINCTFSHPQLADAPQTLSWKLEDTGWDDSQPRECVFSYRIGYRRALLYAAFAGKPRRGDCRSRLRQWGDWPELTGEKSAGERGICR